MTVEEEIDIHVRIKRHWQNIGIEEVRKQQKLYRQAVKLAVEIETKYIQSPKLVTGKIILRTALWKAEARVQRRAIAYFGE